MLTSSDIGNKERRIFSPLNTTQRRLLPPVRTWQRKLPGNIGFHFDSYLAGLWSEGRYGGSGGQTRTRLRMADIQPDRERIPPDSAQVIRVAIGRHQRSSAAMEAAPRFGHVDAAVSARSICASVEQRIAHVPAGSLQMAALRHRQILHVILRGSAIRHMPLHPQSAE